MKNNFFAAITLALAGFMTISTSIDPIPIGSSLPNANVKMKDVSGKEVSLNDIKQSNGLLIMFSCNSCPYVIKNQTRTNEMIKYATDKKIGVAILNSNEANRADGESFENMQEYAKEQVYTASYLIDNNAAMADAFGANRTPECFLFDAAGKLVYHGAIDDNPAQETAVTRKHLAIAMDEMATGKEISVNQSRSVGCGIKRVKH